MFEVKNEVRSHRDLIVWQRSMFLIDECYRPSRALPQIESFGLQAQLVRAAVSVAANIAEGHGRGSRNDYARFPDLAKGSLMEVDTLLEVGVRQTFGSAGDVQFAMGLLDETSRVLEVMRRKLKAPLGES